jgi:cardiolipin synthase
VISSPANGASEAQRVMAALIAGSTRTLYVSNAYFVPSGAFVDALCAASDRGVDVRVLVPGPYHDMKIVRRASRHVWPRLVEHGVGIYEFQPTMMHAKTVVVDGKLVVVGSINFDPRSFALNTEFGVVIVSRHHAADAMRTFEADCERSIRVLPAALASRRVDRAVNAICYWARAQL